MVRSGLAMCGMDGTTVADFDDDDNGDAALYRCSALHKRVARGEVETVHKLVSAGADVRAVNHAGDTPCHIAAEKGHDKIVEILIAAGADVNAIDKNRSTPCHLQLRTGSMILSRCTSRRARA